MRIRDLGIRIGVGKPGVYNAITDVPGVRVGHHTVHRNDGEPRPQAAHLQPCFAGVHVLNGNGDATGLEWIREAGLLTTPLPTPTPTASAWSAMRWWPPSASRASNAPTGACRPCWKPTTTVQMVNNDHISALFGAAADAVEEAILNALLAATDLEGNGNLALALKPEQLLEALHNVGWKADPRALEQARA